MDSFQTEMNYLQKEKIELIEKMRKLYAFLEKQYSYDYSLSTELDEYPGGPKYYINKYINRQAQRLIEIVFYRNSASIYFFLKRLNNNIEPAYSDNDNCFSFYEIDIYNGIDDYERHTPYSAPHYELRLIKVGFEILNGMPDILVGSQWLSREKLDEIYLKKGKGSKSGRKENFVFAEIKKVFEFLTNKDTFKITYDYDKLRPYEQNLCGELIYSNDEISIVFSVDFRDQLFALSIHNRIQHHNILENPGQRISEGATTENDFINARSKLIIKLNLLSKLNA